MDLDAIRARCDAATPGPWMVFEGAYPYGEGYVIESPADLVAGNFDHEEGGIIRKEDAEFIAAARTDVPELLAEIERLRGLGAVRARCPICGGVFSVTKDGNLWSHNVPKKSPGGFRARCEGSGGAPGSGVLNG